MSYKGGKLLYLQNSRKPGPGCLPQVPWAYQAEPPWPLPGQPVAWCGNVKHHMLFGSYENNYNGKTYFY